MQVKLHPRQIHVLKPLVAQKNDAEAKLNALIAMIEEVPQDAENVRISIDDQAIYWDGGDEGSD